MTSKSAHRSVTAIVAAYNEGPRLHEVLSVLCTYPFDDVIVVDDGSTDDTAHVARSFPIRLIRLHENHGKGRAMQRGVSASSSDFIFFCDADVKGLNHDMITQVLKPVVEDGFDMTIAMRNRTIYRVRAILRFIPLLGGERCLRRSLWDAVPARYKENFMIEAALNYYAFQGRGYTFKVFEGLTQTIKEKKYGLLRGTVARVKMFYDVVKAQLLLRLD